MTSIRLHQFTCFHLASRGFKLVPKMATLATIAAVGGRVVRYSEQEVSSGLVDEMGFYPMTAPRVLCGKDARAYLLSIGFSPAQAAATATA